MRLWTLHPKYLDSKGLVTLRREALLGQTLLQGETTSYRHIASCYASNHMPTLSLQ
jgi:hypothetical protein